MLHRFRNQSRVLAPIEGPYRIGGPPSAGNSAAVPKSRIEWVSRRLARYSCEEPGLLPGFIKGGMVAAAEEAVQDEEEEEKS